MPSLSPFWSAAVRLTGRLDLSLLVDEPSLHTLSARQLVARGVRPRHARALLDGASSIDAPALLRITDPGYPRALRRVPFAPPVLFFEGSLAVLRSPLVAIARLMPGPTGVPGPIRTR